MFLQWVKAFQILTDPVKALRHAHTDYYSKVLGVCTLIFSIIVTIDLLSYVFNSNDALDYTFLILLYVMGFGVIVCYLVLYQKFIKLMRSFPDLRRQVHPFFVFMIAILSIKFMLVGVWEFDSKINNTLQADYAVFLTNIGIEILFNILLIYYQVTCNKRQAVIESQNQSNKTPSEKRKSI